jgi:hypothetical protein
MLNGQPAIKGVGRGHEAINREELGVLDG